MSAQQPVEKDALVPEGLHRNPSILVVDADEKIQRLLGYHLRRFGCEVNHAASVAEATQVLRHVPADVVLFDLDLLGSSELEPLRRIVDLEHAGCVIATTSRGTLEDAVRSLRAGAYDFVDKSNGFEDLRVAIRNALQSVGLREEVQQLKAQLLEQTEGRFDNIIGSSEAMSRVMKLVRKVTDSDITVLLEGESGTGKELIANAIHQFGQKRERPFIAINCAAIPEALLETELFGHERGAFTGATERRAGKFAEAHEGTLFLDEIGELSPSLQAKLLRVLQTGEIQPVGGKTTRVRVRIISATNQNLVAAVRSHHFREDLYYRLAVFPINLPPLRERREDIPDLVHYYIRKYAGQEAKAIDGLEDLVMARLVEFDWPGNVRELENMVYRAVVLAEGGTLTLQDFPVFSLPGGGTLYQRPRPELVSASPHPESSELPSAASISLEEVEMQAIRRALAEAGGNMTRAAATLKIGRATLYRKSKKFGL